jgi:hypothetical protein
MDASVDMSIMQYAIQNICCEELESMLYLGAMSYLIEASQSHDLPWPRKSALKRSGQKRRHAPRHDEGSSPKHEAAMYALHRDDGVEENKETKLREADG